MNLTIFDVEKKDRLQDSIMEEKKVDVSADSSIID